MLANITKSTDMF